MRLGADPEIVLVPRVFPSDDPFGPSDMKI